jgi:hypothetical protein
MTLIEQVVAILDSSFVQNLKPFSFRGVSYAPASDLSLVSQLISWPGGFHPIHVETKKGLVVAAQYLMGKDLMRLAPSFTSLEGQAVVVHEAVHAWQDVSSLGHMPAKYAEGAAHIVQMMFLFQQVPAGNRLLGNRSDVDLIFAEAWTLAAKIMGGGTLSGNDTSLLETAVGQAPEYQGFQDYDGVFNPLLFPPMWAGL